MGPAKETAFNWIMQRRSDWSVWNRTIWEFGETAWREYRSAAWYKELLENEGFAVESGSGGMPTAFCARWDGGGPTIGTYAEYDGVPDNCQAADVVPRPRDGLSPRAGGHTDPHSALGIATLVGTLAAKSALRGHGLRGSLTYFGEPAEKVRGSKPIHAAQGYYDHLDAAISFHPFYMLPLCNTARLATHCGAAYAWVYRFTCPAPETWAAASGGSPIPAAHAAPRAPGATDALVQMYQLGKSLKEHVLGSGLSWSMNEAILSTGQATADNLPATEAEISYIVRVPDIATAEHVVQTMDGYAEAAARATHCRWQRQWISKSRPGLANYAMTETTYRNLAASGPPHFGEESRRLAREIQEAVGVVPMETPFLPEIETLVSPQAAEAALRQLLSPKQEHFTSDDYTEYCWHTPTARFYVGRPALAPRPDGQGYPAWAMNALGGLAPCIDPMIETAAKTVAGTILDLIEQPETLAKAQGEFKTRTGGGRGGETWLAPLCDYLPPLDLPWPEYVTTSRGFDWVIPAR